MERRDFQQASAVVAALPVPTRRAEHVRALALSLVLVQGDQVSHDLRHGDYAVTAPCDGFQCDGIYVIDNNSTPLLYRVQDASRGALVLLHDRAPEFATAVGRDWFDQHVLGIVVADLKVRDATRLREAWEAGR